MANIKDKLNNIKNALFGHEVRASIHDGIEAINNEVEDTTSRQYVLENTFEELTINAGNSNAEIVAARVEADGTTHKKLGDRLNKVDSQIKDIENKITYTSVKNFGAKGDGETDDTIAFQQAFDSSSVIYIPEGRYKITSSINIPDGKKLYVYGNKRNSVILADKSVETVFNNINKYSTFKDFAISATNNVFVGSLSYCEFSGLYISGERATCVIFTDIDPDWCGFIDFNGCSLLHAKCIFYSQNNKNYVKFNNCVIQRFKYVLVGSSEVVSFNGCDLEFCESGTILGAHHSNLVTHYAPSFNNCYIEGSPILDTRVEPFDNSETTEISNLVVRNLRIVGCWIYSSRHLIYTTNTESSVTCQDCSIMLTHKEYPIFYMGSDSSLQLSLGYAGARIFMSDGTQQTASTKKLVEGPSRNIWITQAYYNHWEHSVNNVYNGTVKFNDIATFNKSAIFNDIATFNKSAIFNEAVTVNKHCSFKSTLSSPSGIYLTDTSTGSRGLISYSDDYGAYRIYSGSQQLGSIVPFHSANTTADLNTITPSCGFAFGYTKDNSKLYVYIKSTGWKNIALL